MIYNLIKRSIIIDSLNIKGLQFTPSDSKDTGTTEFKFKVFSLFPTIESPQKVKLLHKINC